jgi:Flp pilus assembly protein CpaB
VAGVGRRAQAAALQQVPQVQVVMVNQPIAQHTSIKREAVSLKPFPAGYAPANAATRIEDVVGKYASVALTKDQVVLTTQTSATRRATNLSGLIPEGKVAFWMPLPELLSASGGVRAGDHMDMLLSISMADPNNAGRTNTPTVPQMQLPNLPGVPNLQSSTSQPRALSSVVTQATLQNVEVFFTGSANNADLGPGQRSDLVTSLRNAGPAKVIVFLMDPQEAVLAKYVKDSGGTIDLVLRSGASSDTYTTAAINAETVIEQFKFRVPAQSVAKASETPKKSDADATPKTNDADAAGAASTEAGQ